MNAAQPPGPDDDLVHLNPKIARFASASALLAGALLALDGIQVLASVTVSGAWAAGPWLLIGLGVVLGVLAAKASRARRAAMIGTVMVCALSALASAIWAVFAMSRGLFTLYAVWAPPAALTAAVLAAVSLPACDRAERARERLAKSGLALGF